MKDPREIFTPAPDDFSEEELLRYLRDELPEDRRHALESSMADPGLLSDAAEGLAAFKSREKLRDYTTQINTSVSKTLRGRRSSRRFSATPLSWSIVALLVVLLLCLVGYVVVRMVR